MSNGEELVARLPNPNEGPAFFTVASEVATRQFLRDAFGIPIPQVYSWSAETSNPVGAEYIIEEKARGHPLGAFWETLPVESQFKIIDQIITFEKKLASIPLSQHDAIYYKSDWEPRLLGYNKHESLSQCVLAPGIGDGNANLSDFTIGPSTKPALWEAKRAAMKLDRGPWANLAEYARAIGENEIQWAKSQAKPRMNFQRSLEQPETPDEYISLQKRYLSLVPHLLPVSAGYEQLNTISHPDLHLDNIFIDPESFEITSIIDWQSVTVSPIHLQLPHPQMLELSPNPLTEKHKHAEERLLNYYQQGMKLADPSRSKIFSEPHFNTKMNPISRLPGSWENENLYSLRHALIAAIAQWDNICESAPCPVDFTSEELALHQTEMENIEGFRVIMYQLEDEGYIPLGGMVRSQYYERARKANEHFKQEFIDLAEDESQKQLFERTWPYQ